MKKVVPMTLSIALLGALIAGCTTGKSTGGEQSNTPQPDKKYKLSYLNQNFDKTVKDAYAIKYVEQK